MFCENVSLVDLNHFKLNKLDQHNEYFYSLPKSDPDSENYILIKRVYNENLIYDKDARMVFWAGDVAFFSCEKTDERDDYGYRVYERYQGYSGFVSLHNMHGYPAIIWSAPCHDQVLPEYYTHGVRYYKLADGRFIYSNEYGDRAKKRK